MLAFSAVTIHNLGKPRWCSGEEPTCHSRRHGSHPRSGRFPGVGNANPLQCSCTSLIAQLVKNPPAMQETWLRTLGLEDPLGRECVCVCVCVCVCLKSLIVSHNPFLDSSPWVKSFFSELFAKVSQGISLTVFRFCFSGHYEQFAWCSQIFYVTAHH